MTPKQLRHCEVPPYQEWWAHESCITESPENAYYLFILLLICLPWDICASTRVQVWACRWMPEVDSFPCSLYSLFTEARFLTKPEACLLQMLLLASLALGLLSPSARLRGSCMPLSFQVVPGDLNSCLHVCVARASLSEPSLQTLYKSLKCSPKWVINKVKT